MSVARTILSVALGILALVSTLRADMMTISSRETSCPLLPPDDLTSDPPSADFSEGLGPPALADVYTLLVGGLPVWEGRVVPADPDPPARILSDGQSSFRLCLYALIGLGLFHSAPLVKKLSFGAIPDWYHSGAPAQIGPSYALAPDCLCVAPVHCFLQPQDPTRDCLPQYCGGRIASLWRKSQFGPTVLASRGPPRRSP